MKYTCSTEIALPRSRVVELFDNPDNMTKWQEGLQRFTAISGTPGQVGAKSALVYQMGKRRIEMVETITERALPERFSGTYEAKGVWNSVTNRFADLGDMTRWDMDCEFRLNGFVKIIGWLAPGIFRKQTEKMMGDFKRFAERA